MATRVPKPLRSLRKLGQVQSKFSLLQDAQVWYLAVPEPGALLLLPFRRRLLISWCHCLPAALLLLLLVLHLLPWLSPRAVSDRVFCVGPAPGKRKHPFRKWLNGARVATKWPCQALPECNSSYRSVGRAAKQKQRSDQSPWNTECFPPIVIKFSPHTKTQTNGHSKFSKWKSLSELSHPLPKTRRAINTGRRAYHSSSSTKFHLFFTQKYIFSDRKVFCYQHCRIQDEQPFCFSSADLFSISSSWQAVLSPFSTNDSSKHQCCRTCDNKTGVVCPQGGNKTLAEHRTPFPLLFKYKDLQATLFIDHDSTLQITQSQEQLAELQLAMGWLNKKQDKSLSQTMLWLSHALLVKQFRIRQSSDHINISEIIISEDPLTCHKQQSQWFDKTISLSKGFKPLREASQPAHNLSKSAFTWHSWWFILD